MRNTQLLLLQKSLTDSYLQISGRPNLDAIWGQPTINITTFTDVYPGSAPVMGYSNYSLWDAGKLYLVGLLANFNDKRACHNFSRCRIPSQCTSPR